MTRRQHDYEPVRGLPEKLPAGEHILWQGAPDWRSFARHAFHARTIAFYFGLLILWRAVSSAYDGASFPQVAGNVLWLLIPAGLGLGVIALLAKVIAGTTVYTITNKRVVMRFGAAFEKSINLPFKALASADIRQHGDGTGNIALTLAGENRLAYLHLWPHARPLRFKNAQPMLRSIPDVVTVAGLLSDALRKAPDKSTQDDEAAPLAVKRKAGKPASAKPFQPPMALAG
jgi:hypothetical protein